MILKIRYVPGVDEPTESTYENVTKIDTIEEWGYKRIVFHMSSRTGFTSMSVPAYLISKITIEEGTVTG